MGLRATLPNHIPACRSEFIKDLRSFADLGPLVNGIRKKKIFLITENLAANQKLYIL